jgi:hypothetical protein
MNETRSISTSVGDLLRHIVSMAAIREAVGSKGPDMSH